MQSHKNERLFTRQLTWALQECKRALNNRGEEGREPEEMQSLGLAGIRFIVPAQEHEDARAASAEDSMDGIDLFSSN